MAQLCSTFCYICPDARGKSYRKSTLRECNVESRTSQYADIRLRGLDIFRLLWLESHLLKDASTSAEAWIMANINATGFFMVNYDEENWSKLAEQLRKDHQVIHLNQSRISPKNSNIRII